MKSKIKNILRQSEKKLLDSIAKSINENQTEFGIRISKGYVYARKIDRIAFRDRAIKMLPLIYASNEHQGEKLATKIFSDILTGTQSIDQNALHELSRHLEYSSYYAETSDEKKKLISLLFASCYRLYEVSESSANTKYNAFSSLASEKRWSQYYAAEISELIQGEISRIISCAAQNDKRRQFALLSLKEFLKAEFRFSETGDNFNITISTYSIKPNTPGWEPRVRLIDYIKENYEHAPEDLVDTFSECMEVFIGDCNRNSRSEDQNNDPSAFILKQLEWYCTDVLREGCLRSDYSTRKFRSSWKWFYEWSNNPELKSLASKCETLYFGEPNYERYKTLFDFDDRSRATEIENEIVAEIIGERSEDFFKKTLNSIKKVSEFPNEAHQYFRIISTVCNDEEFNRIAFAYVLNNINSVSDKAFIQIAANSVIKWHRQNAPGNVSSILETYAKAANNRAELISLLYSNSNPAIVGDFSDSDLIFIKDSLAVSPISEVIVAATSLSFSHWDEVRKMIENSWENLSPNQQSNLVYILTEKFHHQMLIRGEKIPHERLGWLIDRFFLLQNLDSISNCAYSFKELLAQNSFSMPIRDLAKILKRRFENFDKTNEVLKLPYRFTEIYKAFKLNDGDSIAEFIPVIELYTRRRSDQWFFGKIFPSLDSSGELIAAALEDQIKTITTYQDLLSISRIAGFYQDTVQGWENIAVLCIRKSIDLAVVDLREIYSSIRWNGIRSYSGRIDEISPKYFDELKHAEERLSSSPPELKEYWKQEVVYCKASIEQAKAELPSRIKRDA